MNMQFNSVNEILDYAIGKEEGAAKFYSELAKRPLSEDVKKVFEGFAEAELEHKRLLEEVKSGQAQLKDDSIHNPVITKIIKEAKVKEDMTIEEALTIAIKREQVSYRLYIELAVEAMTYETLDIFVRLAQEEARHKLWIEKEYKKITESLVQTS
jgi:rubrerythrin